MKKLLLATITSLIALNSYAQPCVFTVATAQLTPGNVTFTTNNPSNTPGITYQWNWGDGTPNGTGANPTHVYTYNGSFNVSVASASTSAGCTHALNVVVTVNSIPANCTNNNAAFNHTVNGGLVTFTNTTPTPTQPSVVQSFVWDFGDNSNQVYTRNANHTYLTGGTFAARLISSLRDTISNTYCHDTEIVNVSITNPPNSIKGYVMRSTSISTVNEQFRVWLIRQNPTTNILEAVDSLTTGGPSVTTTANGYHGSAFTFINVGNYTYRLKAARIFAPVGANGVVPTYYDTALLWQNTKTLTTISNGGIYNNTNIMMRSGTTATGGGSIAGNVRRGTTTAGVENVTVLVKDAITFALVRAVSTDANGDFTISNLPDGNYTIYPEHMNYTTTAKTGISLGNGQANATDVNFDQDDVQMSIKPRQGTSVGNVSNNVPAIWYPNPANNQLYIRADKNIDNASVVITDIMGKTAGKYKITLSKGQTHTFNVQQLSSGIYQIAITTGEDVYRTSLMIRH